MTNSTLTLVKESGAGKLYSTGDNPIFVLQLEGSWREMGQQYGTFAKDKIQPVWDTLVQPILDKKWMSLEEAQMQFGKRVYNAASVRIQQFYSGMAEGMNWPVENVVLLDQSGQLGIYQGKLHSFSGCSSVTAWGTASKDEAMITGRNMDWNEAFLKFPLFYTVYNPTDGSNSVANLSWVGWTWAQSALNDKGVYLDLHDGTSMGGMVVSTDRASFPTTVLDFLFDCSTADAVSKRFNSTKTDLATIWTIADTKQSFSYENTMWDNRRRNPNPEDFHLVVVNSFMNPDWGLYMRDTISNSLTRYSNLDSRTKENYGNIDAQKMMDIFDLRLFNPDGSFMPNGGATKPENLDADLTNYQIVTNLQTLQTWVKIPQMTDWIHVDVKSLFK